MTIYRPVTYIHVRNIIRPDLRVRDWPRRLSCKLLMSLLLLLPLLPLLLSPLVMLLPTSLISLPMLIAATGIVAATSCSDLLPRPLA